VQLAIPLSVRRVCITRRPPASLRLEHLDGMGRWASLRSLVTSKLTEQAPGTLVGMEGVID
jgi:hypothetical protein